MTQFRHPPCKDPFASSNGDYNNPREGTIYGQQIQKTGSATQGTNCTYTIGTNIQNPHTFYYYNSSSYQYIPNATPYYNSWSAKNKDYQRDIATSDNAVTKTIYDPCPVGYTVAPVNAFSKFTTKNWDNSNKGHTLGGLWFFAAGCRGSNGGGVGSVGSTGYYWQAVPYSTSDGRVLNISNNNISTSSGNTRACAMSIRPVAEIEEE